MVSICPKCGGNVPDDAVYCPYCGYGLKPSARTTQVSAAGTLTIVAAVAHLIIFVQSVDALAKIYGWYPATVAQGWITYVQMLTIFCLVGSASGLSAGILSLVRRRYLWTMVSVVACTLSGAGAWITSMIIPFANVQYSFLYYFMPMLVPVLVAGVMIYPRRAEFKR